VPTSWLFKKKKAPAEQGLWQAVLRGAARDLAFSHESEALDALEWLRSTGAWLAVDYLGIDAEMYKKEIARLVLWRERRTGERLPIERLPIERLSIERLR